MSAPSMIPEVADQLGRFPPFDQLPRVAREDLAAHVRLRYLEAGETLFVEGEPTQSCFFVIKKGLISLSRKVDEEDEEFEICDEGDIVGLRGLIAKAPYSASGHAKEESLIYELPFEVFLGLMQAHPALNLYLAAGFASETPAVREELMASAKKLRRGRASGVSQLDESDSRTVEPSRPVLSCQTSTTVQEAAVMMRQRRAGAIIAVEEDRPIGILTDTDLRSKVVAEALNPKTTTVGEVMSAPVMTIPDGETVSRLIGLMMQRGVHHFCVTEDGGPNSPLIGVISEHDVLTAQGSHPMVLQQRLRETDDIQTLKTLRDRAESLLGRYLDQEASTAFICEMISGINDALTESALRIGEARLEEAGLERPEVPYAWLSLGSQGRREQLLRTDQDNMILYADPEPSAAEATKQYFLRLGDEACGVLIAAGFMPCPGKVMANNPELTGPISSWKKRFTNWIRYPEPMALMNSSIYFDLRPLRPGDPLANALIEHIHKEIMEESAFLTFFAANALHNPPPRSFFRSFILERSGEHAESFDVKARAMMPLCDAARVLVHHIGIRERLSTPGRYAAIAKAEPRLAMLASEAGHAYEILLRMRAKEGLRNDNSGRFLDINSLNKLERQTLRNTFSVVESVQRLLQNRFRTDFVRQ